MAEVPFMSCCREIQTSCKFFDVVCNSKRLSRRRHGLFLDHLDHVTQRWHLRSRRCFSGLGRQALDTDLMSTFARFWEARELQVAQTAQA